MARFLRRQPVPPKNGQDATRRIIYAAASTAYTLTCATGAYIYAGIAATLVAKHNYTLACATGAYTYSGLAALVPIARKIAGATGAYNYTGNAATLTYVNNSSAINYTLACAAGSYVISGKAATLAVTFNRALVCASGSYVINGKSADLQVGGALIGRKYPRRGRSRPRKVDIENIPKVIEQITKEKADIAEELAFAQADLISTKLMAHNSSVNRTKKIKELSGVIDELEHNIQVKAEEEILMLLCFMALEK